MFKKFSTGKRSVVAGLLEVVVLLAVGVNCWAADMDYGAYFRGSIGNNMAGGKELQINNAGTSGNEFRLGNEVPYGELNFNAHIGKYLPPEAGTHILDSKFTFAINPPFNTQYGDTASNQDYIQVVQAYMVAQWSGPVQYWIGKRFYRWGYIVMDDFFYFADMSGNGAGADHIEVSKGELALALLQYTDTSVTSNIGSPSKDALDVRWGNIPIDEKNNLDFWGVAAVSAPGTGTQVVNGAPQTVDFKAGHGFVLAGRWNHLLPGGTDEISAQYGTGIMQSLNLNKNAIATTVNGDDFNKENRLRLVNNLNTEIDSHWSLRSGLVYDLWDSGNSNMGKQKWTSIGFRPSYQINQYLQWLVEVGISSVTADQERGGARTLSRISFGPQWGLNKGLAANPVFRAYFAYSDWNSANADGNNPNSVEGQYLANNPGANPTSNPLYNQKHVAQAGVQVELGF